MKKLKKCILNIVYGLSQLDLKFTELRYNIQHVLTHHRKPRKMTREEFKEFERYVNEQRKKGGQG